MNEAATTIAVPTTWAPILALAIRAGDHAIRASIRERAHPAYGVALPTGIRDQILHALDPDLDTTEAFARTYSVAGAARVLGITPRAVRRRILHGTLRAAWHGRHYITDADQVDALASRKAAA